MTVLILADETDLTVDYVVRDLKNKGVPLARIDTAWFPQYLSSTLTGTGTSSNATPAASTNGSKRIPVRR